MRLTGLLGDLGESRRVGVASILEGFAVGEGRAARCRFCCVTCGFLAWRDVAGRNRGRCEKPRGSAGTGWVFWLPLSWGRDLTLSSPCPALCSKSISSGNLDVNCCF